MAEASRRNRVRGSTAYTRIIRASYAPLEQVMPNCPFVGERRSDVPLRASLLLLLLLPLLFFFSSSSSPLKRSLELYLSCTTDNGSSWNFFFLRYRHCTQIKGVIGRGGETEARYENDERRFDARTILPSKDPRHRFSLLLSVPPAWQRLLKSLQGYFSFFFILLYFSYSLVYHEIRVLAERKKTKIREYRVTST